MEVDGDKRAGLLNRIADKLKTLARENRELRQTNKILRKASLYIGQAGRTQPLGIPFVRDCGHQ